MSDTPKLNLPDLDENFVGRNRQLASDALNTSVNQHYQNLSEGTDEGAKRYLTPDRFADGHGYGNDALLGAIRQQALRPYDIQNQAFQSGLQKDALELRYNKLMTASKLTQDELNYNHQKMILRQQDALNRKRARASVLGQILGVVGGVAGGVIGTAGTLGVGTVAGASAGYALGSGLGQAIEMGR